VFKLLLFLHLLTAIFAIGPLVHTATTAVRGLRTGDASATASAARSTRIYSYASVAVVIFGFGLMSMDSPYHSGKVAEFGEVWIWLSVVLWVIAVAVALGLLAPSLERATTTINGGEKPEASTGTVALAGGVIGLLFFVIVLLMVYQPGS
jgi:uncharacterized membrane protein